MVTWVLDGYNLIFRAFREEAEREGLSRARDRLEARLRLWLRSRPRQSRVVLVYDGRAGGGEPARAPGGGGLEVWFARHPRSADDEILALCRRLEGRGDLRVVTSDRTDIVLPLRGLDCRVESSEEFARRLERAARGGGRERAAGERLRSAPLTPEERDGWLREFDLHPEDDRW